MTNRFVVALCVVSSMAVAAPAERWAGERTISAADKEQLIAYRKFAYPDNGWHEADHPANGIEENDVKILDSDFAIQKQLVDERINETGDRSFGYWLKNYCGVDKIPEIRVDLAVVKEWRFGAPLGEKVWMNPIETMTAALPGCTTLYQQYKVDAEQQAHMAIWKKIKIIHLVMPAKINGDWAWKGSTQKLELSFDDKTGEVRIGYNRGVVNMGSIGEQWWNSHF